MGRAAQHLDNVVLPAEQRRESGMSLEHDSMQYDHIDTSES